MVLTYWVHVVGKWFNLLSIEKILGCFCCKTFPDCIQDPGSFILFMKNPEYVDQKNSDDLEFFLGNSY